MPPSVQRLLVGRDPVAAVAAPLVGLLVGGILWHGSPGVVDPLAPADRIGWLLLAGLVVLPALLAWWNDGLVVCWLWDFGPLVGAFLAGGDSSAAADLYTQLDDVLVLAVTSAVLLGTVGFILGVGLRWTAGSLRGWWLRRAPR